MARQTIAVFPANWRGYVAHHPVAIWHGAGQSERLGAPVARTAAVGGVSRWVFGAHPSRAWFGGDKMGALAVPASDVPDIDRARDGEAVPDWHAIRLDRGLWTVSVVANTAITGAPGAQAQLRMVREGVDDLVCIDDAGYSTRSAHGPLADDGAGAIGTAFRLGCPYLEVAAPSHYYALTRRVPTGAQAASYFLLIERLD